MKYLVLVTLAILFVANFVFAASGDKTKAIMQGKFTTYSTNRAVEQARFKSYTATYRLPKAVFTAFTTGTKKRPVYNTYSTNNAVCWKGPGRLGTCTAVDAVTGICTCQ